MGRKKKVFVVYVVIAVVIILMLLCLPFAVQAQSVQGGAHLEVNFFQTFNHVDFTVSWTTDDPDGTWHFLFGDGTETVLTGASGTATFSHDYAYNVGGVIAYQASIELPSAGGSGYWADPWIGEIVIDDRSKEKTYTVYLPLIMNASPAPYCSITVSTQDVNHIVFDATWSGAGDGVHSFEFGDGSVTDQFSGPNGNASTWHDYAYPGGNFIITMKLDGGGSCFTKVLVDWP